MQEGVDVSRRRFLSRLGMAAGAYASSSLPAFAMGGGMSGMKKIGIKGLPLDQQQEFETQAARLIEEEMTLRDLHKAREIED